MTRLKPTERRAPPSSAEPSGTLRRTLGWTMEEQSQAGPLREAAEPGWIFQESPVGTKSEGSFEGQWGRKDLVGLQATDPGVGRVLRPPLRPAIQTESKRIPVPSSATSHGISILWSDV